MNEDDARIGVIRNAIAWSMFAPDPCGSPDDVFDATPEQVTAADRAARHVVYQLGQHDATLTEKWVLYLDRVDETAATFGGLNPTSPVMTLAATVPRPEWESSGRPTKIEVSVKARTIPDRPAGVEWVWSE